MKMSSRLAFGLMLAAASRGAGTEEAIPYPRALERAAVTLATLDEPISDALVLGNGDLNGLLFAEGEDLVVRVTKNDVWDARIDTALDPPLPTLARIKELAFGQWPDRGWVLPEGSEWEGPDSYHAHAYPCPRACAVVRVTGAAAPPLTAKLDARRAVADVHTDTQDSHAFIAADSNVLVIRTAAAVEVLLDPVVSDDIPAPESGEAEGCTWVTQQIPGDPDWPGMSFAAACLSRDGRSVVSVVTSREAEDPLQAALALAHATATREAEAVEEAHRAVWEEFWSASGLEMADEMLERTWYRNLYFLRCVSKPGVVSVGLFTGLLNDKPAWHGDYHTNYNIQQTYWAAYAANHAELAEPYDRLIREYLPRARWLARRVYDCGGAFFPHVLYAYEPPDPEQCLSPGGRQYIHHVWAFTLGVSAFTVQPLWWHYKYAPDAAFLAETAYPAVRDVALFYADFVDQCERDGDTIVLAPTVSPEHHGWTAEFERNRNCSFCIAYAHFVFDAAMEGATTLGCDRDLVKRWRAAKALLPEYPTKDEVVVDVEGVGPITYNIPVPTTPVFPADVITREAPAEVRDLFGRTLQGLRHNGNNAPVMLAVARARLGLPDAYDWLRTELGRRERRNGFLSFNRLVPHAGFSDFGHYTEMFGAALPITELVLQSVGDVLRLFPAWPGGMPARFERLRAQGGFLVSAERSGSAVTALRIESTVGGELRLASPWRSGEWRSGDGPWSAATVDDGLVSLATTPGQVIEFRPKPVWERTRAQGSTSTFRREDNATVMRIRGEAGASTGFRMSGLGAPGVTEIVCTLRGSANAQYFVEADTSAGPVASGWQSSSADWTDYTLAMPAATVESVTLYTWTNDGEEAWNAFRSLSLAGANLEAPVDLTALR